MSTEMYLHSPLPAEVAHSVGNEIVMNFSNALNICITEYSQGSYTVVLPENLQERYGNTLFTFFKRTLACQIGEVVNLTCVTNNSGPKTFVQMRPVNEPHYFKGQQPVNSPQTATSDQDTHTAGVVDADKKKVPRPMNCWLHFRAEMAEKLKKQDPTLSVQQISTHCSHIWRAYTKEQKKTYKLQAAAGVALHKHMNPNYKYQPRRAGEKKKRQSRRAKEATAAAAAEAETFSFTPVPATMASTHNTEVTVASLPNIDNAFGSGFSPVVDYTTLFGLQQQGLAFHDQLHDTESLRHDRLHAEFDSTLGMNMSFEQFGEEAFAFRAGADGSATLPSIYSDRY